MRNKLVTFDDLNTDLPINKRGISIAVFFSIHVYLHVAGCAIGVRISVPISSSLHPSTIYIKHRAS